MPTQLSLDYQVEQHKKASLMQRAQREGNKQLYKQLNFQIKREIINKADVILATCMVANSGMLCDCKFTRVLMDEASQANEVRGARGCHVPLGAFRRL
jgi:translation initiation factor 6 (eIF-6)